MADSAAHQYRQCKTHNCDKHDWSYRYFQKIAFHRVTFLSSHSVLISSADFL